MKLALGQGIGVAIAAATVISLFPQRSFAQTGYGTYVSVSQADVPSSFQTSGGQYVILADATFSGFTPALPSTAEASLPNGSIDMSATFTGDDSTSAQGYIYDTIQTGIVPVGAEAMLTINSGINVTPVSASSYGSYDYYVEDNASFTASVSSGNTYTGTNLLASAQEGVSSENGTNTSYVNYTTNGTETSVTSNSAALSQSVTSTFALASNTEYLILLQGEANVNNSVYEYPYPTSHYYYGSNSYSANVDPPSWSLTTTPGVTYTTASGIPIGGFATFSAPEASSLGLIALAALPLGACLLRRRGIA